MDRSKYSVLRMVSTLDLIGIAFKVVGMRHVSLLAA